MTDPPDPFPEARAFCRAVIAAFPGVEIVKRPLSRPAAKANGLPLPPLPQWKPRP